MLTKFVNYFVVKNVEKLIVSQLGFLRPRIQSIYGALSGKKVHKTYVGNIFSQAHHNSLVIYLNSIMIVIMIF